MTTQHSFSTFPLWNVDKMAETGVAVLNSEKEATRFIMQKDKTKGATDHHNIVA